MKEKKKNKKLIVIIAVLSLLVIGTGIYFAYEKIFKEDKPVEESQDNKDNNINTESKMNSSYDNNTILKSLVDAGFIEESKCDSYCTKNFSEGHYGWTYKINENKKLELSYYDSEYEKSVTKSFDEIGNVTKVFPIYRGGTISYTFIFTENNDIYFFEGTYQGQTFVKVDNNVGKKLKSIYIIVKTGEFYVAFDDDSLFEIIFLDNDDNLELKVGKNIRDINLIIGDFTYSECSGVCATPDSLIIYGNGTIIYRTDNDDDNSYSAIKYNGKVLDIKYIYFINNNGIRDLYFVDNNNDIYVIYNFYNYDKRIYSNNKIEKLSYKFDSLKTNKDIIYEENYSYDRITYTAKFSDGTSKTFGSFTDLTNSYYTSIFNLYK